MTDKTWKAIERKIALYLGGERVPVTGRQRGHAPDVKHEWLAIEVKHRKGLPFWLKDAMDQADKSNKGGQLPVAILHEKGQAIGDCLILTKLRDFREWFGDERGGYQSTDDSELDRRKRDAAVGDSSPQVG